MTLFNPAPKTDSSSSGQPLSQVTAEQPILWLGISGFAPQHRALLEASLVRPADLPQWRTCVFADADAWCVNGAKVKVLPDGNLKVAAGLPTEHALRLNLTEVDRPVAFAEPFASPELEPRCTFNVESPTSIQAVLLQFENWLRLVRSRFVIGARIIHHGAELRHGIFHVSHAGVLLAVLDFRAGTASLSPRAHPVDLWQARWDKRPLGASGPPAGFVRLTPAQCAWAYVRRTDRELLPPRYAAEVIYFRGVPKVPMRWLSDSQLMLVRELSAEASTLESLRQRTGFALSQMRHDLTCLYYAGSITTTLSKAAAPMNRHDKDAHSSSPELLDSLLGKEALADQYAADFTAPAVLEHKRATGKP